MKLVKHIFKLAVVFIFITTIILQAQKCVADGYVIPPEDFMYIAPGMFTMGDNAAYWPDEQPVHQVTISKGFGMQKHELTQGQWVAVMGTRPWLNNDGAPRDYVKTGRDFPAVFISWNDAQTFISKLNLNAGQSVFRLPTEAEWEYACRAGTTTEYSFGDDVSRLGDYAWFKDNAWDTNANWAHEVELKSPNPWCLYDMHGNVFEWCSDWYVLKYSTNLPQTDPKGPDIGVVHVFRGGSFIKVDSECRSARRHQAKPIVALPDLGFRLVRTDIHAVRPTLEDLMQTLKVCAGTESSYCMLRMDINHDGRVNLVDAISVIQMVSGLRD